MNLQLEKDILAVVASPMRSSDIASALGLEVFQVTARLASMAKRQLLIRDGKLWGPPDGKVTTVGRAKKKQNLIMVDTRGAGWKIRYRKGERSGHSAAYFLDPDGNQYHVVLSAKQATHVSRAENPVMFQMVRVGEA